MGVGELAPNQFSSMHLHVCRLGYTGMYKPVSQSEDWGCIHIVMSMYIGNELERLDMWCDLGTISATKHYYTITGIYGNVYSVCIAQ